MKTFNRLISYFKYEPMNYTIGIILSLFAAGSSIYVPMIGKKMIDYVSEQLQLGNTVDFGYLMQQFGFFMLMTLFSSICGYFSYYY